jgi:hypothetical protein
MRLGAVIGTLLALVVPFFAQSNNVPIPLAPEVKTLALSTPNMPIQLLGTAMQADYGRGLFSLHFTIANSGSQTVKSVNLLLLALSADNQIKGGETFRIGDLVPGDRRAISTPLASKFEAAGDHAIISVIRLTGESDDRSVAVKDVLDAVATNRTSTDNASVRTAAAPEFLCNPEFCRDCKEMAVEVCGSRGVKSVSCALNTCSCSFTCR